MTATLVEEGAFDFDESCKLDEWVRFENLLGLCYLARQHGSRSENVEKAIKIFSQLDFMATMHELRGVSTWRITLNLATAYAQRVEGDEMENRERALQLMEGLCEWAIEMARTDINSIVSRMEDSDTIPVENLAGLGAHYLGRRRGNVARNRDNAIECYEFALPSRVAVTN